METLRYWWRARALAWQDTRAYLGHNWVKTILGLVGPLLTFGSFGFFADAEQVAPRMLWWGFGLGASVSIFVAVFLFHLFAAPKKMEAAASSHWEMEKRELSGRIEKLLKDQAVQASEIAKLRTQLEKQKTGNSVKATRIEIQRWADAGMELIKSMESYTEERTMHSTLTQMPPEMHKRVTDWLHKAERFVMDNAPSFLQHYRSNTGIPPRTPLGDKKSPQFTQLRNQVADRVDRLRELMDRVS